jgi:adenosylcobinamide kinase/adenosylcobinamide-phosphate guanylyltransferase
VISMKKVILVIGGARSGKSTFAQELARKMEVPVLFVATAEAGDEDMQQRIENHKRERPVNWRTLETTQHVGNRIELEAGNIQVIILDCITLLVNNIFNLYSEQDLEQIEESVLENRVTAEINELIECTRKVDASFIIVSNEVGLGLVPGNRIGRLYRDLLGRANQRLAGMADEVYLMVAGLPMKIKPADKT